jgi:hypothetical protein
MTKGAMTLLCAYWWLLRYPSAFLLGFLVQSFYLPGTVQSPLVGLLGIFSMFLGTCLAYMLWWR